MRPARARADKIEYDYNATGQKVEKIVTEKGVVTNTKYLGEGFQYKNDTLEFFPTAEGYVRNISTNPAIHKFEYVYNFLDHLGNVRVSYAKNLITNKIEILEENNYYPFGLKMAGFNSDNLQPNYKYKYQGQERQDELGLNWDSFKWRNYMPDLGRFFNIDPLSEKYAYNSTYAFQENKMGMGRELEGLELVPMNPTASFGNWISGKYDSAVSSMQTTSSNIMQTVSNAVSSLEIRPVDGYRIGGVTVGKNGIGGTPGLFNPSTGATSSGTIDGDFVQGLAAAFAPKLSGVMDGANIFSNLVQDPIINNVFDAVLNNSSSTTTATTNSNGTESTITVQRFDYSAPDPVGVSQSIPFAGKPRDTTVRKGNESTVNKVNTRDSIKAAQTSQEKNIEHKRKFGN